MSAPPFEFTLLERRIPVNFQCGGGVQEEEDMGRNVVAVRFGFWIEIPAWRNSKAVHVHTNTLDTARGAHNQHKSILLSKRILSQTLLLVVSTKGNQSQRQQQSDTELLDAKCKLQRK
jgi:hypothetical protein